VDKNCDIIRDLMPACIENTASEASQQAVMTHISTCQECRKIYEDMSAPLPDSFPPQKDAKETAKKIAAVRHKRIALIALAGLLVGMLIFGVISLTTHQKFYNTPLDQYEVTVSRRRSDNSLCINFWGTTSTGLRTELYNEENSFFAYSNGKPDEKLMPNGHKGYTYTESSTHFQNGEWITLHGDKYMAIYKGTPENNALLWKAGEDVPYCSEQMENYYACQDQLSQLRTEIAAFVGFDNVDQLVYGDETFAKESELLTTYPDAVSLVNSYWETWHRTNEIEKLVPEWYEQVK